MELQIRGLKVDAGEGSRGGKIIGHTKSGKPVYSSHGHPSHGSFSKSEHIEAGRLHSKLAGEAQIKQAKLRSPFPPLYREQKHHEGEAAKHSKSSKIDMGTGHVTMAPAVEEGNIEPEKRKKKKKVLGGASNPSTGTQSGNGNGGGE